VTLQLSEIISVIIINSHLLAYFRHSSAIDILNHLLIIADSASVSHITLTVTTTIIITIIIIIGSSSSSSSFRHHHQ